MPLPLPNEYGTLLAEVRIVPSPWPNLKTVAATLLALPALATAATVNSDGTPLPDRALDQSTMLQQQPSTAAATVTADGTALPTANDADSSDDSFGKQVILKAQERPREFALAGDASMFYTSNVALARRDEISDSFFVANASAAWTHAFDREWQMQVGARFSIFRYNDTTSLDFDSVAAGLGVAWAPAWSHGVALFARYDLTQLFDRDGHDLLTDNEFSISAQKLVPLSRAQALSFQITGAVGIADPHVSQRDTIGAGAAYHVALTRHLELDLAYRAAVYFYDSGGRDDFNQLGMLSFVYHFNRWATLNAMASYGDNRSNRSVFDYGTFVTGGGLSLGIRF
jgi:hypothetical protein